MWITKYTHATTSNSNGLHTDADNNNDATSQVKQEKKPGRRTKIAENNSSI